MFKNNLSEFSDFSKKNNSYFDYNLVSNLMFNLNFTKYRFNNKNNNQLGGSYVTPIINQPQVFVDQNGIPINNQQLNPYPLAQSQGQIAEPLKTNTIIRKCSNYTTNVNGIPVQQQICKDEIEAYPDKYLSRPNFLDQSSNTYTIKAGTILYHAATNKRGFNTHNIELGNDRVILFFTPNFRLASDRIEGCSVNKQKSYIHVFKVKQDIPNICVKLPYDTSDDISPESLHNQFCSSGKYSGVGFFYPKNEIELFSNMMYNSNSNFQGSNVENEFYSEFGLCNPTPYLEYLYSQKCESIRKLSQRYRFDR